MNTDLPVSQEIIQTIASLEGVDVTELTLPLNEAIDPEALDRVLESSSATVTFEYSGYRIRVDNNSNIDATPLQLTE